MRLRVSLLGSTKVPAFSGPAVSQCLHVWGSGFDIEA